MGYRNIFIASPAKISCRNEQLIINTDQDYSIPIEDISCLLLEEQRSKITVYTLSKLADSGVSVLVCNKKHLPTSILMPKNTYSRQLKMLHIQLKQSKPHLKRMWQQIVVVKINNQGKCLELCNRNDAEPLYSLARKVQSGDPTNMEGVAAKVYFKSLFGQNFSRASDCMANAALNYGYAIIRGVIAKSLAAYGFEPCLGIHHHSELNNFNLADDLIEPFRPIVDLFVASNMDKINSEDELTPYIKQSIFNLLNISVSSGDQIHSMAYAVERMIMSLSGCFRNDSGLLVLPKLIPLKQHEYE